MLIRLLLTFRTLVGFTFVLPGCFLLVSVLREAGALASTPTPRPDLSRPQPATVKPSDDTETLTETSSNKPDTTVLSTTDILPSPPPSIVQEEDLEPVFLYRQEVTPRVGLLIDFADLSTPYFVPQVVFGFTWTLPRKGAWHAEFSLDAISDSSGAPGLGWRYNFNPSQMLRPFVKAGLKTRFIPKEEMATLINFNNYQLTVGGGMEDQLRQQIAVHIELEGAVGPRFRTMILFAGAAYTF